MLQERVVVVPQEYNPTERVVLNSRFMRHGLSPSTQGIIKSDFDGTIAREPGSPQETRADLIENGWPQLVRRFQQEFSTQLVVTTGRSPSEGYDIGKILHQEVDSPWMVICENGGSAVVKDENGVVTTVILDTDFYGRKAQLMQSIKQAEPLVLSSEDLCKPLSVRQQQKLFEAAEKLGAEPQDLITAAKRHSSIFFLDPGDEQWRKIEQIGRENNCWSTVDMPHKVIPHLWGANTHKEMAASELLAILNGNLRFVIAAGNSLSNDGGLLSMVSGHPAGVSFYVGNKDASRANELQGFLPVSSHRHLPTRLEAEVIRLKAAA